MTYHIEWDINDCRIKLLMMKSQVINFDKTKILLNDNPSAIMNNNYMIIIINKVIHNNIFDNSDITIIKQIKYHTE